jgi:hypothetical protein
MKSRKQSQTINKTKQQKQKLMLNILWQENKIYTFQTVQVKDMS